MWKNKDILHELRSKLSLIIEYFKQIIKKIGIISKDDRFIIIDENKKSVYKLKEGLFYPDDTSQENVKNCLISDTLIDLKLIVIPVVSHRFLRNIVINTVKKHSTVLPSNENIDL